MFCYVTFLDGFGIISVINLRRLVKSYLFNFWIFATDYVCICIYYDFSKIENVYEIVRFIKVIIGINCCITIVEYFDVVILEDMINIVYRGAPNSDIGNRAIGLFYRVHGAAYFSLFSFIFIFSLFKITNSKITLIDKILLGIITLSLMTTFSKGAILILAIYLILISYLSGYANQYLFGLL